MVQQVRNTFNIQQVVLVFEIASAHAPPIRIYNINNCGQIVFYIYFRIRFGIKPTLLTPFLFNFVPHYHAILTLQLRAQMW